jgi:hypothetical protein
VEQLDDPEAELQEQDAIEDVMSSLVAGLTDSSSTSRTETSVLDKARHLPNTTSGLNRRLSVSVRKGELNPHRALLATQHIDREVGSHIAQDTKLALRNSDTNGLV